MTDQSKNWLLASLSEANYARILSASKVVQLEKRRALYEPDGKIEFVYFPLDCVVSVLYAAVHTASAEIAVVGREGVVGLETLLKDVAMPRWAVVQRSGSALRVPSTMVKAEFGRSEQSRDALNQYLQALLAQMLQLAVCNRHHDLAQQVCRLLLSRLDRNGGNTVDMSHEALAQSLGTSPERITRVAMDLWSAGAIDQSAGYIKVLDRTALEGLTCACYGDVRDHYDQRMSGWRTVGRYVPMTGATDGEVAVHE